ncbi:hypothetical protein EBN03_00735 [Nocardia stercoris]|uniref:Chemotaxis methyl-accepting receptor HlyB-like 4HB MCP domain-containing protein n=1 Tax=Nocardia stercoris TaxID=2483361 RepID=A0A3M2LBM4_9NOCA|nr:hypothetical protein EBN03_00735 [Nocardia stercoris]
MPTRSPLARLRDRLPHRADLPAWIRLLAAVAVIAGLLAALCISSGATSLRNGIDVIGHRTEPQVSATEDLSLAFADMDAQLANLLLAGGDPTLTAVRDSALKTYEDRRKQADADLQQASSIAGQDEHAKHAVQGVLDQFGTYEGLAAKVILLDQTEHNPAAQPAPDLLDQYRQSAALLADQLLPAAHGLTGDNTAVLQNSYTSTRGAESTATVLLIACGVVLLGALIGLQVLLVRTMHRRINPGLLGATLVSLLLLGGAVLGDHNAVNQLQIARYDAFDSLIALDQARAIGYDANADESRYLLDPDKGQLEQQAFLNKSQALADLKVSSVGDYDAALTKALAAYRADHADIRFGGAFGDEMRNITFPGERAAAEKMLASYQVYQRDDRTLRATAKSDPRQAVTYDTDAQPGTSDGDFGTYDTDLSALIAVNQHAFDTAVTAGSADASRWSSWLPFTGALLIAALVLLGIRPRLNEYR